MKFIKEQIKAIISSIFFLIFFIYFIYRSNPEWISKIITSFQDGTWITYGIIGLIGIAIIIPVVKLLRWIDWL